MRPPQKAKPPLSRRLRQLIGRDDKIRTCDPLHPMQVRYRAALRPEKICNLRYGWVTENEPEIRSETYPIELHQDYTIPGVQR